MLTDDPILDEERRQAEWDAKCAAAPRCCRCNGSVYPHDTYLEIEGMIFCERCVRHNTRNTADLEV